MKRKHPSQVTLDPDEIHRANRVQVARQLGKFPHEVDTMPAHDFDDVLQVTWAEGH